MPGFFISALPVTVEAYLELINDLHETDPDEAWRRVPRATPRAADEAGQHWSRPADGAPYEITEVDEPGAPWDSRWPVTAVSWRDAQTFVSWASKRVGLPLSLPTELWWEKAARGVDGRSYPWGDGFDPCLCKMAMSRRGRPAPEPVGTYVTDLSVYGVRDVAGSARDWCADTSIDAAEDLRPVRGGSWNDRPDRCRLAARDDLEDWNLKAQTGFRLARLAPVGPDRRDS